MLLSSLFYYTSIDAPEDDSIVPSFIEATGDQVYVRFHGRNREYWFKRNITAAERFNYLYSERELHVASQRVRQSGARSVSAHIRSSTTAIRILES
jgi:uncharacterized protein YecE (DUF72 family)